MTVRNVLCGCDADLSTACVPVCAFDSSLMVLAEDLQDTLVHTRSFALAANQLGDDRQVLAVDTGQSVQVLVNPVIAEANGEQIGFESCLSFPNQVVKLSRPASLTVEAVDACGQPVRLNAAKHTARAICQAIDLLNGVTVIDRLDEESWWEHLMGDPDAEGASCAGPNEGLADAGGHEPAEIELVPVSEAEWAADMMADLSWKFSLCLEILASYRELWGDAVWTNAECLAAQLQAFAKRIEDGLEDIDQV